MDQKLIFIFVDDNGANPWTTKLRTPVETKIATALRWLEDKAQLYGIQLHFQHECVPIGTPVACHAGRQIDETDVCAGPGHSTWQNQVVTRLTEYGSVADRWDDLFTTCGVPLTGSEGSALFFCVRRYYPSIAFPFFVGENVEFERERGIIYDNGGDAGQWYLASEIAHEVLHLYGAVELKPGKASNDIEKHSHRFVDDVMYEPTQRPLNEYCISDLTAYLVGWSQIIPAYLT
jgi:hypothetical protein